MTNHLNRSINEPIREGLTTTERWSGPDMGLIWCWERGRQKRAEDPELAKRAKAGELVMLAWRGGVDKKLENERKNGSLTYLATWQGLRGQNLDIAPDEEVVITCARWGQMVVFSRELPENEEQVSE